MRQLDLGSIDGVLDGTVRFDDPEWGRVAEVLDSIQKSAESPGDAFLHRLAVAAATAARNPRVASRPTSGRRRHRVHIAAAAAAATTIATFGLAAADTLPRPLQSAVSRFVGLVGVNLPDGEQNDNHEDENNFGSTGPNETDDGWSVAPPTTTPSGPTESNSIDNGSSDANSPGSGSGIDGADEAKGNPDPGKPDAGKPETERPDPGSGATPSGPEVPASGSNEPPPVVPTTSPPVPGGETPQDPAPPTDDENDEDDEDEDDEDEDEDDDDVDDKSKDKKKEGDD